MVLPDGGEIHWHSLFQGVPDDAPVLFVGQEILDALPVHQFEYTAEGWRERLVDLAEHGGASGSARHPLVEGEGDSKSGTTTTTTDFDSPFRFVLSEAPTPAVSAFLRPIPSNSADEVAESQQEAEEEKKARELPLTFAASSSWRQNEIAARDPSVATAFSSADPSAGGSLEQRQRQRQEQAVSASALRRAG